MAVIIETWARRRFQFAAPKTRACVRKAACLASLDELAWFSIGEPNHRCSSGHQPPSLHLLSLFSRKESLDPAATNVPACRTQHFLRRETRGQKAWRARGASRQSSDPHSPSDPRVRLSPAARPYPEAQFAKQDLTSTSPQPTVEFIPVPFRWLALTAGSNRAVLPRRVGTARSFDSQV